MRVLNESETVINVEAGDTLVLEYTDRATGEKTEILHETLTERMQVNYCAAVALEKRELDQLGLDKGVAGVFGHKPKPTLSQKLRKLMFS